jgi:hypothetical protein
VVKRAALVVVAPPPPVADLAEERVEPIGAEVHDRKMDGGEGNDIT